MVWGVVLQARLIPAVFEHVLSELTAELTVALEQQILTCQFNQVWCAPCWRVTQSLSAIYSWVGFSWTRTCEL